MSWLPAPKTLWGLVTSQESRLQSAPTLKKHIKTRWSRPVPPNDTKTIYSDTRAYLAQRYRINFIFVN